MIFLCLQHSFLLLSGESQKHCYWLKYIAPAIFRTADAKVLLRQTSKAVGTPAGPAACSSASSEWSWHHANGVYDCRNWPKRAKLNPRKLNYGKLDQECAGEQTGEWSAEWRGCIAESSDRVVLRGIGQRLGGWLPYCKRLCAACMSVRLEISHRAGTRQSSLCRSRCCGQRRWQP